MNAPLESNRHQGPIEETTSFTSFSRFFGGQLNHHRSPRSSSSTRLDSSSVPVRTYTNKCSCALHRRIPFSAVATRDRMIWLDWQLDREDAIVV